MVKVKVKCPRCKNAFEHEVDLSGVIETEAKKRAQNLAPPKISPELKKQLKEEAMNAVKFDHAKEIAAEREKTKRMEDRSIKVEEQVKKLTKPINQGSPELDGEVQEIVLENYLKNKFPSDKITPIPKGKKGADCIHEIIENGKSYGKVLWESKRTENFSSKFISKLLEDMEMENIGLGIIATENVPKNFKGEMEFREKNKIIICKFNKTLDIVSELIRLIAITASRAKNISKNKDKNQQKLWEIFTSDKFTINFNNLVKSMKEEKDQLEDDIADQEKSVRKRKKNIEKKREYFKKMIEQFSSVEGPLSQNLLELKD